MPLDRLARGASYALVLLLTVLLAVWGAFLVPLRIGGVAAPVGLLLALATVPLCRAGSAVLGRRAGGGVAMLLWVLVALLLASERREGDLVITSGARGVGFLVLGFLGAAVGVGSWQPPDDGSRPNAAPPRS